MNNKIKSFFKENLKFIFIFLVIFLSLIIELPFYIETSGGILNLDDRIDIENSYPVSGSLNMTYVSEMKANIFMYVISLFNKNYDLVEKEDIVNNNETEKEMMFRSKLLLDEANNNSIILAYKKASKNVNILSNKIYVTYIDELAKTNLKIGDQIIEIDNISVNSKEEINKIIENKNENDTINITVISDEKKINKTATLINYEDKILIGVMISEKKTIETEPKITLNFKESESGSSGGLMTTLAIYNYLIEEDITQGLKISGTGTIDSNGKVGEISGVKYKLRGAVKEKADLFIVPNGENYKEALYEKEINNYNINIIGVDTFDEALDYLIK